MAAISDFFFLNRLSENIDCETFVNRFYNYADYASEYLLGFSEIHSKKFIKTSEYMELYNQYILVYSDEFSDIVLLSNRWNNSLRILCCCEEPRLYSRLSRFVVIGISCEIQYR